jgi:peptide-methionine (S)-S-oxide reductase
MTDTKTEQATFAAGCFWGVEAELRQIPGVIATTVGYTGGRGERPTYEQVCSHTTGHAEGVLVEFDPAQVSYEELLDAFWRLHDPTQLNRQGPDVGDQYRSAIFFHSPEQEASAKASREAAQERFSKPIVTEITEAPEFWPAEDYHQRYLEKRGLANCAITVSN